MDTTTARGLIALNNRFYAEHAASFSATRSAPWAGWQKLVEELCSRGWAADRQQAHVLDLACGNLRFERFLTDALPDVALQFHAIDSCPDLAGDVETAQVSYRQLDILAAILDTPGDPVSLVDTPCDLAVCFGFMHHVPGVTLRQHILDALIGATAPHGSIAVSFWQFMDDGRLAAKADRVDATAVEQPPFPGFSPQRLEAGDHFLGWQNDSQPLRYCHHFTEAEIDALVAYAAPRASELARWSADGSSGTLNRYLLLQRR